MEKHKYNKGRPYMFVCKISKKYQPVVFKGIKLKCFAGRTGIECQRDIVPMALQFTVM